MVEVSMGVAFVAGLLSFFSPCVFPLIPGYLAHISGSSLKDVRESWSPALQTKILMNAIAFTGGFSAIFVILGMALAGAFGFVIPAFHQLLNRLAGIVIIAFGFHIAGLIHIPGINRAFKPENRLAKFSPLNSSLLGASFGAGWTPCFGPILASILVIAGTTGTPGIGAQLLALYSLGLAVPFILTGLFTTGIQRLFVRISSWTQLINYASGGLLVALGLVVFTGSFARLLSLIPGLGAIASLERIVAGG